MKKEFRLMGIAGGGIGGVGPARYMALAERKNPNVISDMDLFCATSIGSPLAGMYSLGYPAQEVDKIIQPSMPKYFSERTFKSRFGFCPKWSDRILNRDLNYYFGNRTLADTKTPVYIVAWDAVKKDIKVYGPKDAHIKLKDAIRQSVAAPTYYAPVRRRMVDGGVAANNPLLCGLAGGFADDIIQAGDELKLFELVTSGKNPPGKLLKEGGNLVNTLKQVILPCITTGNSSDVGFIARAWLKSLGQAGNIFTIRPDCKEYDVDDVKFIKQLTNIWEKQWQTDKNKFHAFLHKGNK